MSVSYTHLGEILKISNNCELILNIYDLDINQRKMLNALYDEVAREINDTELLMDWRTVNSNLECILNQAIDGIGYEVSYGELDLKTLFKAVELKFQEAVSYTHLNRRIIIER